MRFSLSRGVAVFAVCVGATLWACTSAGPREVKVDVRSVGVDRASGTPVVVLEDAKHRLALPIWIGANEAQAIAMQMEGITPPRPMTHDLMKNVMEEAGVAMERVVIAALRGNTYHARIYLRVGSRALDIDSRPSDAIALAVRFHRPIFVARALFSAQAQARWSELAEHPAVHIRGITVQALTAELADYFGVGRGQGVLVSAVAGEGTPLRRGDVIVAVDGAVVNGPVDFARRMRELGTAPAGLLVQRAKSRLEVRLESGDG